MNKSNTYRALIFCETPLKIDHSNRTDAQSVDTSYICLLSTIVLWAHTCPEKVKSPHRSQMRTRFVLNMATISKCMRVCSLDFICRCTVGRYFIYLLTQYYSTVGSYLSGKSKIPSQISNANAIRVKHGDNFQVHAGMFTRFHFNWYLLSSKAL